MGVEKGVAQKRGHALAFARIEAVLHVVGTFVPLGGRIARVFGQILLIDAVGAHQRQGVATTRGGEGDAFGRDVDTPLEGEPTQRLGGGVGLEGKLGKQPVPCRARQGAAGFEQGFEEVFGAFVATVVLTTNEVAAQPG